MLFAAYVAPQVKVLSVLVTLADNMKCFVVCCFALFYAVLFYPTIGNSCCLQMLLVCFVGIHSIRDIRNLRYFAMSCSALFDDVLCYYVLCFVLLCDLCHIQNGYLLFLCYVLPCWLKIITFQLRSQPSLHAPSQRAQISFPVPRRQLPD